MMKRLTTLILITIMTFSLFIPDAFASSSTTNQSDIIATEIIINVTPNYDGTLNDDLTTLGITSVTNIFDVGDTIMYLVTTDGEIPNIIENLEKLSYINYAEYNQLASTTTVGSTTTTGDTSTPSDETTNEIPDTFSAQLTLVGVGGVIILALSIFAIRKTRPHKTIKKDTK